MSTHTHTHTHTLTCKRGLKTHIRAAWMKIPASNREGQYLCWYQVGGGMLQLLSENPVR